MTKTIQEEKKKKFVFQFTFYALFVFLLQWQKNHAKCLRNRSLIFHLELTTAQHFKPNHFGKLLRKKKVQFKCSLKL